MSKVSLLVFIVLQILITNSFADVANWKLLNKTDLNRAEAIRADQLMIQAHDRLSPYLIGQLKDKIKVRFLNIEQDSKTNSDEIITGYVENMVIHLDRRLLSDHSDTTATALSTLIHEIGHIFDYSAFETERHDEFYELCAERFNQQIDLKNSLLEMKVRYCQQYLSLKTGVSTLPEFQTLAGFSIFDKNKYLNLFSGRQINKRSTLNVKEAFAVHFEKFFLDSEYQCRFPAMAEFLSKKLYHPIKSNCLKNFKYFDFKSHKIVQVPHNRVYAVDYLWAAEGSSILSRFGHAMLRLVVCADDREIGPDCYKDTEKHLVINFLGVPEGLDISVLSGLTGQYPLNMMISPFTSVLREFTITEQRPLYALPLKLDLNGFDKSIFLNQIMTSLWTFESSYSFTFQNCTTEALRHMNLLAGKLSDILQLQSIKPNELFEKLLASPLNLVKFQSKEEIQKNKNLFFESRSDLYAIAFKIISPFIGQQFSNFSDYTSSISSAKILKIIDQFDLDKKTAVAFMFLEQQRYYAKEKELVSKNLKFSREKLNRFATKTTSLFRFVGPLLNLNFYGVPTDEENDEIYENATNKKNALSNDIDEMNAMITELDLAIRAEILEIKKTIIQLEKVRSKK